MQKVEGSSPFSRFELSPANARLFWFSELALRWVLVLGGPATGPKCWSARERSARLTEGRRRADRHRAITSARVDVRRPGHSSIATACRQRCRRFAGVGRVVGGKRFRRPRGGARPSPFGPPAYV